jgi:hypothetical protein
MSTRDRFGGSALANPYELIDDAKLNQIGLVALQNVAHQLTELCRDAVTGAPRSGCVGDDLRCANGASALDVTVGAGVAWMVDAADTSAVGTGFKPVVIDAARALTLDPHDLSHPRVDLVVARPATIDDERVTRTIFDVSTGGPVSAALDTVRRLTAEVDVLTGTPGASPAEPAVPAGWMLLCRADVPAVSGTVTLSDRRPLLGLGHAWAPAPARGFAVPHVIAAAAGAPAGACAVSAAGTSLEVKVARGDIWVFGLRRRVEAQAVALPTHATLGTRGYVVVNQAGVAQVLSASIGWPSIPAERVVLARWQLGAAATVVSAGDLTDMRSYAPYSGAQLQPATLAAAALVRVPVGLSVTVGAELTPSPDEAAYSEITVDCQLTDADGNPITFTGGMAATGALAFRVELIFTDQFSPQTPSISAPASFSSGSPVQGIGKTLIAGALLTTVGPLGGPSTSTLYMLPALVARPDAAGRLALKVYDGAGINRSLSLLLTPLNWPGHATLVELPFRP